MIAGILAKKYIQEEKKRLKLFIAGVGSGNSEFITIAALNAAKDSF